MPPEIIIVVNHYAYNNGSVSAKSMARLMFSMGKFARMMFTAAVERWTVTGRPYYYQTVENWWAKDWRSFSSVELVDSTKRLPSLPSTRMVRWFQALSQRHGLPKPCSLTCITA